MYTFWYGVGWVAFVECFDNFNKKWEDGKASWKDGSCNCCCKMVGIMYKTNSFTFLALIFGAMQIVD